MVTPAVLILQIFGNWASRHFLIPLIPAFEQLMKERERGKRKAYERQGVFE